MNVYRWTGKIACILIALALVSGACGATPTSTKVPPTATRVATMVPTATAVPIQPTTVPVVATATKAVVPPTLVPPTPIWPTATVAVRPFSFGVVLVGPYNDHGYSEAHYVAGQYVEKMIPGAKMVYFDKANTSDRKG